MSLEQSICKLVKQHWNDLYSEGHAPDSLILIKVAGKLSPNANIIAMIIDAKHQQPVAVAKIPRNPQSTYGLEQEYYAMTSIQNSISNSSLLDNIPYRGTLVEIDGIKILLQTAGEGYPMVRELTNQKSIGLLYKKIVPWMFEFHLDGSTSCVLEGNILHKFVKEPVSRFLEQHKELYHNILSDISIHYLSKLSTNIEGLTVHLCRQHGDFNAHNILVNFNGKRFNNFTLIDWEDYNDQQLPIHDLNHFFTSNSHLLGKGRPPEDSYAKLILNKGWYQNLYHQALTNYEKTGLITHNTFLKLTPLYHIGMCFRLAESQRQQLNTAHVWIKRMDLFINNYLREIQ